MPRIPKNYLDTSIYLYQSEEDAISGKDAGGSGFLISVPSKVDPNEWFIYAISNRHVVRNGSSVIRVNRIDGGADVLALEPHEWDIHPSGDDVAIASPTLIQNVHLVRTVPLEIAVRPEDLNGAPARIAPGDEVFQIGRFMGHDGTLLNVPSARFGHVSILRTVALTSLGHAQESFGVEVHSISGYSGSPVFVVQNMVALGDEADHHELGDVKLLGVCWAHIGIPESVGERILKVGETLRPGERIDRYVNLNSGMELVVPAWKLWELVNLPHLIEGRERREQQLLIERGDLNFKIVEQPGSTS